MSEALESRLDEFIFQAQRLLTDQGGRLERVEATLETLATVAQNHERRLAVKEENGLQVEDRLSRVAAALETLTAATITLESHSSQVDDRLDRVTLSLEAVADGLRNLQAGLSRLEAIQEQHLRSHP
jgi:chromosome segregation ATPase